LIEETSSFRKLPATADLGAYRKLLSASYASFGAGFEACNRDYSSSAPVFVACAQPYTSHIFSIRPANFFAFSLHF
jgi:hypothetical protein